MAQCTDCERRRAYYSMDPELGRRMDKHCDVLRELTRVHKRLEVPPEDHAAGLLRLGLEHPGEALPGMTITIARARTIALEVLGSQDGPDGHLPQKAIRAGLQVQMLAAREALEHPLGAGSQYTAEGWADRAYNALMHVREALDLLGDLK